MQLSGDSPYGNKDDWTIKCNCGINFSSDRHLTTCYVQHSGKKKHTYVSIHVYKRKIWLKTCLKLRVECGWDLILAKISIEHIHGLFDLQPCCIYMLFYSFMTRVEFWIRPDRCPPVHYAETSMKNGFGLKYIHKFLNLPFLLLQVCILWKILPGLIQAFG